MRHLTVTLCLTIAVLLGSMVESFALPECPGSYNETNWTNCEGIFTYASGDKYVGEFKYRKYHGQGTWTTLYGSKYVGEWKDFKYHGQGTYYTKSDGDKYVGGYKDGKKHDRPQLIGPSRTSAVQRARIKLRTMETRSLQHRKFAA
jgi:hypothetical protein